VAQDVDGDQHDADCEHGCKADESGEPKHPVTHGGAPAMSVAAASINCSRRAVRPHADAMTDFCDQTFSARPAA
jgi:hypothetical protein